MTAHALLGASKAHRWIHCPGSIALEAPFPDTNSSYADDGTRMHTAAAEMLLGQPVSVLLDDEELDVVQTYVDWVRLEARGHQMLVEQRVDYSDVIGVPDSFGTADAIVLAGDTIKVIDLKTGRGVKVDAEENEQLMLYALGALEVFGVVGDFKKAKLVIVQPRLGNLSEWEVSIADLEAFAARARSAARAAYDMFNGAMPPELNPSEDACRFCKAKASCPALLEKVQEVVGADFDHLDADEISMAPIALGENALAIALAAVPLVEDWCKAIRARVESDLLAGKRVPGFKLVQGKKGHRKWNDEKEAEAALKKMKLKVEEMYDLKLISPTTAEKLAKAGAIGPRQWPALQGLIVQKAGPPSVAPDSDKRPAWSPADDFEVINEEN